MRIRLKPYQFLLIGLIISIVSCQHNSNKTEKDAATKSTKDSNIGKSKPGTNCDTTLISHEFSYDALRIKIFKADTDGIKSLFLDKVILRMEKRTNPEGGTYYLYHFTDSANKINLYFNKGFYLENAEILNDRVLLNKKIAFGMRKAGFLKLFKVQDIQCDTINVVDNEYSMQSIYIFKNDKLTKLKMGQTVE